MSPNSAIKPEHKYVFSNESIVQEEFLKRTLCQLKKGHERILQNMNKTQN